MLKSKDYLFVGIQGILFLAFLWPGLTAWRFSIPNNLSPIVLLFMGFGIAVMLLAILQLNKNLSPFPTPRTAGALITYGIFKYIRHPIYTGILILGISWAIVSGSYFRILLAIFLMLLFYFKSNYEEKLLLQKFEEYEAYSKKTGRFLPKLF